MSAKNRVVIVGAGVAGLSLAYFLKRDGRDVVLIEKEHTVGGLARSFEYDGFAFDIGPHRFHTENSRVTDFIHEILGDDYISIERKSGVWMFDRYFDWPLRLSSVFRMPLPVIFRVARDIFVKEAEAGGSFKDYIIGKYGRTLYEIFFEPYTVKFLKLPCDAISRDWAVTGIDRAVIDKRVKMGSLGDIIRTLLRPAQPLEFIYPRSGGIGVFSERVFEKLEGLGAGVMLGSTISEVLHESGRIKGVVINGEAHPCDLLVWSAPISGISRLLGLEEAGLGYLALLLFNYAIRRPPAVNYQWCYFGSADIPFNRVSVPSLFNPRMAPAGKSGICAEVTCAVGSPEWERPELLEPAIRPFLSRTGLVESGGDIESVHIEKIPNAYPVYTIDYRERLGRAMDRLGAFANLRLLGRTGTFWYNNMDHSIEAAMSLFGEVK